MKRKAVTCTNDRGSPTVSVFNILILLMFYEKSAPALSTVGRFLHLPLNQILCGRQVIETNGFDQLQSICATSCFCDRCAGHKLYPNRPKIDKTEPPIRLQVVINIYNFDKRPFSSRNGRAVNHSF